MDFVVAFFRKRFIGFGLVGLGVMLAGILFLYILVHFLHINVHLAYFLQAVFAIELNFILNKWLNWRDREGSLFKQWLRFHATKIGTVLLNQVLFAVLVGQNVHYLIATLVGVAVATILNYITNDLFVFTMQHIADRRTLRVPAVKIVPPVTSLGIIVPVRNSGRTIRQCIASLLNQDYHGFYRIYIVGEKGDNTWEALGELAEHFRVQCVYIERPYNWIGRDANLKRYHGGQAALADGANMLAYLDSQVMAPPHWISRSLLLLRKHNVECLGGISCRHPEDKTLAGVYQDGSLVSEWPRYGKQSFLSKESFTTAKGLPITASFFMSKQVFRAISERWPMNEPFGWDDFLLSWEIVSQNFTILCTDSIQVYRNHIRKFRLSKQFSSGMGAIHFYQRNPDCGYIRLRLLKAVLVGLSMLLFPILAMSSCLLVGPLWFLLASLTLFGIAGVWSAFKARNWRGLCFPLLDTVHVGLWIAGAAFHALKRGKVHPQMANLLVAMR